MRRSGRLRGNTGRRTCRATISPGCAGRLPYAAGKSAATASCELPHSPHDSRLSRWFWERASSFIYGRLLKPRTTQPAPSAPATADAPSTARRRMKFQCDRCKTRYSIGDDRVRGKILKIRCKNCSAVVTVREASDTSAAADDRARGASEVGARIRRGASPDTDPGVPSPLRGAFEDVLKKSSDPSASDSLVAPKSLAADWYVSIDGVQAGPYSVTDACEWVAGKPVGAELFCWSEGFGRLATGRQDQPLSRLARPRRHRANSGAHRRTSARVHQRRRLVVWR